MRILVLGGIRSGKSQWAETAIAGLIPDTSPVRYLATGQDGSGDTEWSARIAAHRQRRPSHWSTVETPQRGYVGAAVVELSTVGPLSTGGGL